MVMYRSRSRKYKRTKRIPKRRVGRKFKRGGLTKVVRRTVDKMTETKFNDATGENQQLYHNTLVCFNTNLLYVPQGSGGRQRVGESLNPVGCAVRLWLSNKSDRPNVMYRIFVLTVPHSDLTSPGPSTLWQATSGNKMIDYININRHRVLFHKILNPKSGDYSLEASSAQKEMSRMFKFYIKFDRFSKCSYQSDNGTVPELQKHCVQCFILAYDAYGSVTTDNIASYTWLTRLYYKDS